MKSGPTSYDGHGTRTSRTIGAATQRFAWDTHAGLPLVLTDGTTSYLYDDAGTPIEQVDPAGVALYYGHDQYGSTRLLTDAAGAVAATFTYDPYGNLTAHTGTADTPLRWNGQYQDADTGLYYLRARYYDPVTAQFLTRDPLTAFTLAAYAFGGGNPLNMFDPLGLWDWNATSIGLAALATAAGIAAVALTVTGAGAPLGIALGEVALGAGEGAVTAATVATGLEITAGVSGLGASVIDCSSEGWGGQCGADIAATALGAGGLSLKALSVFGRLSWAPGTVESLDTVLGINALAVGIPAEGNAIWNRLSRGQGASC